MVSTLLFPSSFYDLRKVDEDMQQEYDAALETGLFRVILFSYDDWFNRGKLKLSDEPQTDTHAVYRGWMMKPEQYQACLENADFPLTKSSDGKTLTWPDSFSYESEGDLYFSVPVPHSLGDYVIVEYDVTTK